MAYAEPPQSDSVEAFFKKNQREKMKKKKLIKRQKQLAIVTTILEGQLEQYGEIRLSYGTAAGFIQIMKKAAGVSLS